jgi:Transmembrane secretion effector
LAAAYQTQMPSWVKARGMSYYLVALQGSNAVGGLAFGTVAQASSVSDVLNPWSSPRDARSRVGSP